MEIETTKFSELCNKGGLNTKNTTLMKKAVRMYVEDCIINIANGYPAILPGNTKLICELRPIKEGQRRHFSTVKMVNGEKEVAMNTKFPNDYISVNIYGSKAEILGLRFKASKGLRSIVSKRCFAGFNYKRVEV